ncbi:PTS transporter subunit IIC [Bacillus salitolerans]|uniref:PTS transporter subunit IIC n=1 Tax=Bacillus salitolerans TaxID=1437434 RepID=A0ABW4LV76_9BACI
MLSFLRRKGVTLSAFDYFIKALQFMALGLFSTLIIGLIIETIGTKLHVPFLIEMGTLAKSLMGPGIGAAVAYGLKAPPLVIFAAIISGAAGASLGGPVGSYVAAVLSTEIGKMVHNETKLDIILTPLTTILVGYSVATFLGPPLHQLLTSFGALVNWSTSQQPFVLGILVAALMGLALTAPISSAAISLMLGLEGSAAGAATIGCAAQMIGFGVSSYRENGVGGLLAIGLGTSMLQVGNIIKNPLILIPPTIAGIVLAPIGTILLPMSNNAAGAGMGTSGLVGPMMTFAVMGFGMDVWIKIALLHFIGPAMISLLLSEWMRKKGFIKYGDLKIRTESHSD